MLVRDASVSRVGCWWPGLQLDRLRVSNFGDGDCEAGEIHTRARARNFEATRSPFASRRLEISRARVCVFRPPHNRHRQN